MRDTPALPLGRSIACTFGPFVPVLRFVADDELELSVPTAAGIKVQRVAVAPVALRGGLVMLSWTERDGTVVVHVHDYETMVVHSHARVANGELIRAAGTLRWV